MSRTVCLVANCIGCHGLLGDGKGPANYFMGGENGPAPRNLTDAQIRGDVSVNSRAQAFGWNGSSSSWGGSPFFTTAVNGFVPCALEGAGAHQMATICADPRGQHWRG